MPTMHGPPVLANGQRTTEHERTLIYDSLEPTIAEWSAKIVPRHFNGTHCGLNGKLVRFAR